MLFKKLDNDNQDGFEYTEACREDILYEFCKLLSLNLRSDGFYENLNRQLANFEDRRIKMYNELNKRIEKLNGEAGDLSNYNNGR